MANELILVLLSCVCSHFNKASGQHRCVFIFTASHYLLSFCVLKQVTLHITVIIRLILIIITTVVVAGLKL